MMTLGDYIITRETLEDMLAELTERKCRKTAKIIKRVTDKWVQIEKDLKLKERLPKNNGILCNTCGHVKKHEGRDSALSPLFYCGLHNCDLQTDLLGRVKRLDVCLSENKVPAMETEASA